jgi:hypothetical protein
MKHSFVIILIAAGAFFLCGCATTVYREVPTAAVPPGLTLAQIKETASRGVGEETILSALRASRAVYRLNSKDVVELQEAGVSQAVIDYLLSTPRLDPPPPPPRNRAYYYFYYDPWPYWWHDWHGYHGFHHGHH